jgi:hypothetical protein
LELLVLQNSQENAWKLAVLQLNCVESGTFFWDLRLMGSAKLLLHQKVNFHHLISTWTNRKDGSQEATLYCTFSFLRASCYTHKIQAYMGMSISYKLDFLLTQPK